MTDNAKASPAKDAARKLLRQLQKQFPVIDQAKPLAIGIDAEISAALPELDTKCLRAALRMHTGSTRYLKATASENRRYSLAGEAVGELTEEHRKRATTMLEQRRKRREQQEREQREQAELERRAEKLQQLAARFSRDGK
ncbi:MAG: ProQ activator of osmoprotectant transporter prop [Rhodocyclaceae bacterium]|nr:ProQ activator of osmoprotectant transporter prop [Rhodocyclaceae bacterium]